MKKLALAVTLAATVAIGAAGSASAKAPAKCRGQVAPPLAPGLRIHDLTYVCVHGRNGGWVAIPAGGSGGTRGTPVTESPFR
jgi:hypothetical protein